jgi:hypothetical protein
LLDVDTNMKSVIDFERVGYVPDEWIRTKFRVCSSLDLSDLSCYDHSNEAKTDLESRCAETLGELEWSEVAMEWKKYRVPESM